MDNKNSEELDKVNSPIATPDFMREKIKQRPINKKKLLRRTLITMTLAVVFGAVACLTFVFLSPVINNMLYPEKTPAPIALTTEDTVTDEIQPEDMYADDNAIAAEAASVAIDMASTEIDRMQREINSFRISSSDYADMYSALKDIAYEGEKSIVKVTALTSDTNWINDPYNSTDDISGLIVADNGSEYLILVQTSAIKDAESVQVTFADETSAKAYLKLSDKNTGLSVIAVKVNFVSADTKTRIATAKLGKSNGASVTGTPVIAIGSPTGTLDSISYGFVTSSNVDMGICDSNYKLLTTDIYGSSNASGAIIDLSGAVIGFTDMDYNSDNLPNVLCAIGITELKSLIEDLSNGTGRSYLGLHGQSVPEAVQEGQSIPAGAYITRTEMDSPAMLAGIQSGDIITRINDTEINGYDSLVDELIRLHPGADITLTLMRQATDGYVELNIDMEIGSSTGTD
ncbi:S1C family serine protease [Butyrivibrio sp. AE3006]|uniref:S1C family serine protease n=1 Tax=Butyrivibrio sp. AE3006 TaxID=1280673 RepID=UPI000423DC65|nr:S1C family serine protease [Butyrivibrio sp. AE3006]